MQAVEQLDGIMRELIDACYEFQAHKNTLDQIRQAVLQGEQVVSNGVLSSPLFVIPQPPSPPSKDDVIERYQIGVKSQMSDYRKQTSRQKYSKDPYYKTFKEKVWVRLCSNVLNLFQELTFLHRAGSESSRRGHAANHKLYRHG